MNILAATFNFESHQIRTTLLDDTVWFVAKDLAEALGYPESKNALALCKSSNYPWNAELNKINNLAPATKWIPESDMYRLIMRSNKPEAEKFQDWVVEEVLPTIRKTGKYSLAANDSTIPKDKLEMDLLFAKTVTETLRLPESGKLLVFGKIEKAYNLTPMLPVYAIDAPAGSAEGSSKATKSATALLKEHGNPMTVSVFNRLAEAAGFLETLTRESKSKGLKDFKSVTEAGLRFGKNLSSPMNTRETTPHWYVETFGDLLELLA